MIPPTVTLLTYANPITVALDQVAQAEKLIEALSHCQCNFIHLDFSGVDGVSREFSDQFIFLVEDKLGGFWLEPRNYSASCGRLVKPLLNRLKLQREQAWIEGCERFPIGESYKAN